MKRKSSKLQKAPLKQSKKEKRQPTSSGNRMEFKEGEYVTVRSPDDSFFLGRVLAQVNSRSNRIPILWFDKVAANTYKTSYKDKIFRQSVLSKVEVKVSPKDTNQLQIKSSSVSESNQRLTESLQLGEVLKTAGSKRNASPPKSPSKKRKVESSSKKLSALVNKKPSKVEKVKKEASIPIKRGKGLIPNPEVRLLTKDPVFCKDSTIPLPGVKWAIRAVLTMMLLL